MADPSADEDRKNELLRVILEARQADSDSRWTVVFLAIFWPGLESLCVRRQSWTTDLDELWQSTVTAFLETLRRIDLGQRSTRLVQKIINDTAHRLHDEFLRSWHTTNGVSTVEEEELQELSDDRTSRRPNRLHVMSPHDAATWQLRLHVTEGRISEDDYRLIVGTRIQGYSLADFADATKANYQTLKKRRQRAEACIRKFEQAE
jgi:hypothetical protein